MIQGDLMDKQEILSRLNTEQQKAVLACSGPVLILAGAGSGKTRVLVHRTAYLIDVLNVNPGNILAITFTNKAADEMRKRVDDMIGFGGEQIQVSTFHSFCVRILRRYAENLGFTRYFSIYDTDDQLTLMKQIFHGRNIDTKMMKEKAVLHAISSAKDELVTPSRFRQLNSDYYSRIVGDLYEEYQRKLKENNAMDFDDLIVKTVELFESDPEALENCQERYQYLMVDEYQDTNTAQFRFISLLAARYRNLCVVGDDDQSIYKFRGANIRNILNFEKIFPDAKVVRLEQNYRSTGMILDAANEVISHNHGRKEKRLWTENEKGEKISLRRFENGFLEAEYAAKDISEDVSEKRFSYKDCAVLYRTNAQSRLFEEKFLLSNIPYRIVGGINFYSRKEIKDLLAYLKTIDNGRDDLAVRRIINIPKRGIGTTTITKLGLYAEAGGISFFESACDADNIPGISAATGKKLAAFTDFIGVMRARAETETISGLLKSIVKETGYEDELRAEDTEEAEGRLENIDELISKAVQYEESSDNPSLSGFLEEVALIADIDETDLSDDRVLLMTIHAAKGLEFPSVYIAGLEEGLFPSRMSIDADDPAEEIEEERRLAYVAITRAKQKLTLLAARERMIRGDIVQSPLSRFVREIPRELIDLGEGDAGPVKPAFSLRDKSGIREAVSGSYEQLRSRHNGEENSFRSNRDTFKRYANPYTTGGSVKSAEKILPDYQKGDQVKHVKFGIGRVLDIADGGRDYVVTVDFPGWGTKKLMAAFAKLKKV